MKQSYFTNENGTFRVDLDENSEVKGIYAMPEGFKPPAAEPVRIPKKSELKTNADRARHGRAFGFADRKNPEIPCLLELE